MTAKKYAPEVLYNIGIIESPQNYSKHRQIGVEQSQMVCFIRDRG